MYLPDAPEVSIPFFRADRTDFSTDQTSSHWKDGTFWKSSLLFGFLVIFMFFFFFNILFVVENVLFSLRVVLHLILYFPLLFCFPRFLLSLLSLLFLFSFQGENAPKMGRRQVCVQPYCRGRRRFAPGREGSARGVYGALAATDRNFAADGEGGQ